MEDFGQCFFRRRWPRRKFSSTKRIEFSLTRLKLRRKVGDLRQNDDDDDDKSRIFVNETLTITISNEWRKVITKCMPWNKYSWKISIHEGQQKASVGYQWRQLNCYVICTETVK